MNIEQLRQEVDRIWDCYNGMMLAFMDFGAQVNRASGAINVTENFSPEVYLDGAKKRLAEIEKVIKDYRNSEVQNASK